MDRSGVCAWRHFPLLVVVVVVVGASCASPRRSTLPARAPSSTTTTASPPSATTAPAPLRWAPCRTGQGPSGDQCATLTVSLDYQHPEGTKIGIALARKPATGVKYGSLLLNPGGPGASGVDGLDTEVPLLSATILQHFDLIGWDPRGVARSAPIHCATGPELDRFFNLDPAPPTDAGFQALLDADRQFDQGCQAKSGSLLPHVGTADSARDMEEIRLAVGDTQLTYMGFSYGSFLGATYAELFPTHIRAMVLDGAIDPAADPVSFNIAQSAAFNNELLAFFAQCAGDPSCSWRPGGDLRTAFDALMNRLRVHPLAVGTRSLGPGQAFYGVALPLYDRTSWPDLATALELAGRGDGSVLLKFSDLYTTRTDGGSYSNEQEANTAVNCLDTPWPRDPNVVRQYAARAAAVAPEFGVADLNSGLACSFWPVPPNRTPHAVTAPGSPPIVVVGSTGDPATPYSGAQALAHQLSRGVLLTRVGDGHTGYRSSACIRSNVDAYLLNLTVPVNGTSCPTP